LSEAKGTGIKMDKIKKNCIFNLNEIQKKEFEDRWVKFAFGPQGFLNTKSLNLGIVNFSKNKTSLNHRHDVDEALFVLSGKGKVRINDTIYTLKKNDFAYIPKETDHQIITGDRSIKIFFIFGGEISINY